MADLTIASIIQAGAGYLIYTDSSGAQFKRTGNRNWRNNNPGNLNYGSFAQSHGAIGSDGRFAIFSTPEAGFAAQESLLFGPNYVNLSIADAIAKYAPPSENNTSAYINSITSALGVPSSTKLSSLSASQRSAMIQAMAKVEGYVPGTITPVNGPVPATQPSTPQAGPKTEPNVVTGPDATQIYVPPEIQLKPIPNPLNEYASYTYNLSLHLLTRDEYNLMAKQESYKPNRVLIASAGRYNNTEGPSQFIRSPHFTEDFYFENLDVSTVIGLNSNSRSTNALSLKFTIIEPYGLTLLDRIMAACAEIDPEGNYLDMPYLFQIDFFGITDAGDIQSALKEHTKYIPCKIISLGIKTSHRGTEYTCEAIPYNHTAFDIRTVTTPVHFEVVAGTVESFFQSVEAETYIAEMDKNNQRAEAASANQKQQQASNQTPSGQNTPAPNYNANTNGTSTMSADPTYKVKSYGGAINAYQQDLINKKKQRVADKYLFKFYGDIGKSKFVLGAKLGNKDTPMTDPSNAITSRLADANAKTDSVNYSQRIFSINTGTSLDAIINFVMNMSDYVQSQIVIPEDYKTPEAYKAAKEAKANQPLSWFKITPTVELNEYDKIQKAWGRTITYHIEPYLVYNTKISSAPQGVTEVPLKDYQYYYTGKNTEIIDLNIEFNALYYTAVAAYKANMPRIYDLAADETDKTTNADNYQGTGSDPNAIMPIGEKVDPPPTKSKNAGEVTPRAAATAEISESIYSQPAGDMSRCNFKVIGDPTFIKQDDIFYGPKDTTNTPADQNVQADPRLTPNNSIKTDGKEVYVQIVFRSPVDLDENTSLMNFDDKYKQSKFSGMYKVLKVDSHFSGGQFTQTLDSIRLPRQKAFDYVNKPAGTGVERQESLPPGQAGISETYMGYPDYSATTKAASIDDTAPNSTPVVENVPPILDSTQQNLFAVNQTASTSIMTDATEPYAQAPDFTPISVRGNQVPGAAAIV